MEFTITRKDFASLLDSAITVVPTKTPMPVLAYVHLSATAGSLTVSATDLMLAYRGTRAATVSRPGDVCVPARVLRDVVTKMPDGDVRVSVDKNRMSVRAGKGARAAGAIPVMDADQMPKIETPSGVPMLVPAATLSELKRLTSYAMSPDDTRPWLAAVFARPGAGSLRFVATDGNRMSVADRVVSGIVPQRGEILPAIGVQKIVIPASGTVKVTLGRTIFFEDEAGNTWSVKSVDATFPSYEQVIPSSSTGRITCNRAALLDALEAVITVTRGDIPRVLVTPFAHGLRLEAESMEAGKMNDEVEATVDGDAVETTGLNGVYLREVLRSLASETVTINTNTKMDAVVIRSPDEGDRFLGLIMPFRV